MLSSSSERAAASSFVFVDTLIILCCFIGAHRVYLGDFDFSPERLLVLVYTVAASCLILIGAGVYSPDRELVQNKEVRRLIFAWIAVVLSLGLFAFALRIASDVSRFWVASSAVLTLTGLVTFRLTLRMLLRWSRKRGMNIRHVAVVGIHDKSLQMARYLARSPWRGLAVSAMFHVGDINEQQQAAASSAGVSTVKPVDELISYVEQCRDSDKALDQVWLAMPLASAGRMESISSQLEDSSVDVYYLPDAFARMLIDGEMTDYGELSLVNISRVRKFPLAGVVKRGFDFVFALCVLLLVSPLLLLIALAIRLDSPGQVIFQQRRYGIDGQVIKIWKFRTMRVLEDGADVPQAQRNDPRVTRVGQFLRHTSLDELPQFFNVLQGRMSVVGPRPHPVAHNEEFRSQISGYMMRHKFKPGITGWAQVNGWRGETDTLDKMQKRVDYDLQYIRNWSIWFDIKIILMTLFKGFTGKNAY